MQNIFFTKILKKIKNMLDNLCEKMYNIFG